MKNAKIDEAKANLLEINEVIKQLDESLREAALQVLVPMYFPDTSKQDKPAAIGTKDKKEAEESAAPDTDDLGNFIGSFEQSRPAENVMVLDVNVGGELLVRAPFTAMVLLLESNEPVKSSVPFTVMLLPRITEPLPMVRLLRTEVDDGNSVPVVIPEPV